MDWGVSQSWAAIYQSIARRTWSYQHNSEALKVSTKELKEQVLSPNEPSVNMERIVRQARSEKHKKSFPDIQRTRSTRDPSRQCGEIGGASDNAHDSGAGVLGRQRSD